MAARVQLALQTRLDAARLANHKKVQDVLAAAGFGNAFRTTESIQSALSALVRSRRMSLPDVVRLVRGESAADPRPNKALDPNTYRQLLVGYVHQALMVEIATRGFRVGWLQDHAHRRGRPANHRSAEHHATAVTKSIIDGAQSGTYLVLDGDLLDQCRVHISPFGVVPKTDGLALSTRLIHDLSFPAGGSVNERTIQSSLPPVAYEPVSSLARRIEHLYHRHPEETILLLKGDVKGAFRHLRQFADDVHWMGGIVPATGALVVDMSAPFGWTGSPALYGVFGRAISFLVGRESPASMYAHTADITPFFQYEWVDDHVLIEVDVDDRCRIAEDVLRLAMLAVLGPEAINESKFTPWSTSAQILGLHWDSASRTVAMPVDKVAKALQRVDETRRAGLKVPTIQLQRLLGSLRHVASCLRAARPFYQRLHSVCARAPRHGTVALSAWARDDLLWFERILQCDALHGVPTRLFVSDPPVDVHIYMDASDDGLCVLDPACRRFIAVQFSAQERSAMVASPSTFDINVREHFAIALASVILGPHWRDESVGTWPHIRCWTDNTTAAARTNKLSAQHPQAQELNRCIGFAEAAYRIHISSAHMPGAINVVADAGSSSTRSLPNDLQRLLVELQASSLAPSSRVLYDRTWCQWCEWRHRIGAPVQLSRDPDAHSLELALFAVACWSGHVTSAHNSHTTVLSKCSHIAWHHRVRYGYGVQVSDAHRLALLGMRRLSSAPSPRAPVTIAILAEIRRAIDFAQPRDRVLWGATVLGFCFLLRRSEYLSVSGKLAWFIIKRQDVRLFDKHGRPCEPEGEANQVTIRFGGSKTDQFGNATARSLTRSSVKWLCPVRAVAALMRESAGAPSNVPLCSVDGEVIRANEIERIIKLGAARVGKDASRYGTHSLRSGGATSLFEAGCSDTAIKLHGRWTSDCFQRYIRMETATVEQLADMVTQAAKRARR